MSAPRNGEYRELWAKSAYPGRDALSLLQHSRDTETAARTLFGLDQRWGRNFCRFFKLSSPGDQERFLCNLRVAALFHDIGKANEDFQAAVRPGEKPQQQSVRHEHLSALLLCLDSIRDWLGRNPDLDIDGITAAVLSHHLKASRTREEYKWCQPRGKAELDLYLAHKDMAAVLDRVRSIANLPLPPHIPRDRWSRRPPWMTALRQGQKYARKLATAIKSDPRRRGFVLALKAGVIAADSAASGLRRTDQSIPGWIHKTAHKPALTASDLERDIIGPRCDQLGRKLSRRNPARPFELKPFQRNAAELGGRALLLAGCGSGKTLAAWKWAQAQLRDRELGHVVFLYPTRGTATEGFRDYVAWAPESDAALLHGTAEYELEGMYRNPSEAIGKKRHGPSEADKRLFALGLWSRRYFSATVDQFLAFLEHRYESLCLLPLLADSAIILDEVHSYDRSMFENLSAFLHTFDVPVLCMTATMPPSRRRTLEDTGLRTYPTELERAELDALESAERHPRYHIHQLAGDDIDIAFERAACAYRSGLRVLWVVNTVARCQGLARRLSGQVGHTVLAYHSRYRLMDRQARHQDTVAAFQQRESAAIAVTTQVCEMSLDLDADVLLTEEAPISSLVQRFGRANRHAARGPHFRAAIYVYPPESAPPYKDNDLSLTRAFLGDLAAGDASGVSQRTLAEALERHSRAEPDPGGGARFIDSGYFATPGSFRDDDDFSVQCVLDRDLAALIPYSRERSALNRHLPGYLLSVPRRAVMADAQKPDWLPRYLEIAPSDCYHPDFGFAHGEPS